MGGTSNQRCESCGTALSAETLWVCSSCGFHNGMPARARLHLIADPGSLGELVQSPSGGDPLQFVDLKPYPVRVANARATTGEDEAFIAAPCTIGGVPSMVGAFDFAFMGGSMSSAVGERVTRVFEQAEAERRAVVLCTASGGARMQEGTLSLFQMTKTVSALQRFRRAKKPYIAVLCHPTLGGVAASFGTLADVLIAEPQARIGFAGPRVIEQLLGHPLPEGFQRAEFLFERGFIDRIVARPNLRAELVSLVSLLSGEPQMDALRLMDLLRSCVTDEGYWERGGGALREFAAAGGQQAIAMSVLDRLRAEATSEEQEDRILELMDRVSGWTSANSRIWSE